MNTFMSQGEQLEFQLDLKNEQTFQRNRTQKQGQNRANMDNQNNNNNPANHNVIGLSHLFFMIWIALSDRIPCEPLRFQFGYCVSGVWRKRKVQN